MAETSDSFAGSNPRASNNDPSPGVAHDSSADFWYGIYAKNKDVSSRLDHEWGYVYEKSDRMKKKKRKKDVGSNSAACSASDLSEALSAVSAALSLSSSSHSSSGQRDREQLEEKFGGFQMFEFPILTGNLQCTDNSTKTHSSLDIVSLSSEDNWDNLVSADRDSGDGQAKSNFDVNEEMKKGEFQIPEIGMMFTSEEAAYRFYENYANKTGFRVRKGKVRRLSDGTIRKRYFFCSRQGFRSEKQSNKITKFKRKETRTGCDAKIQCTVENGKWVVSQITHRHNHQIGGHRHQIGVMVCRNNEADMAIKRLADDVEKTDKLGEKLSTSSLSSSLKEFVDGNGADGGGNKSRLDVATGKASSRAVTTNSLWRHVLRRNQPFLKPVSERSPKSTITPPHHYPNMRRQQDSAKTLLDSYCEARSESEKALETLKQENEFLKILNDASRLCNEHLEEANQSYRRDKKLLKKENELLRRKNEFLHRAFKSLCRGRRSKGAARVKRKLGQNLPKMNVL